jgi:quinohemoprotein ethanol dehydrogenase
MYKPQGMPDFTDRLKDDDVVKIIAFIQGVADSVRPKEPAASGSK